MCPFASDQSGPRSEAISFVTCVNDFSEFQHNLGASPAASSRRHEWIVIDNTDNKVSPDICKIYNDALARASNDLVLFFHQDVFVPPAWETQFYAALAELEQIDRQWGVLGAAGVVSGSESEQAFRGHWADPHNPRPMRIGPFPAVVFSLDELCLGVRKRRGLSFDPNLPGFHCYGTDICLTAASRGLRSYALDALVFHKFMDPNGVRIADKSGSKKIMNRATLEFQAAAKLSKDYVGKKWRDRLPFRSTSMSWKLEEYPG
jgi:hypothetical protein